MALEQYEPSAASRASSMERPVQEVRAAGNCSPPERLGGELINLAKGEVRTSSLRARRSER